MKFSSIVHFQSLGSLSKRTKDNLTKMKVIFLFDKFEITTKSPASSKNMQHAAKLANILCDPFLVNSGGKNGSQMHKLSYNTYFKDILRVFQWLPAFSQWLLSAFHVIEENSFTFSILKITQAKFFTNFSGSLKTMQQ